ncbi:MAG TPA: DUF2795 domain-containing protein [Thermomicrobiales bacterium]|jgi:hypothetical protein|nr:DUF2795 domain-containing protein [Thermomicrobiales bacterium]
MDSIKNMAGGGGIGEMLKGINFPINKNDLVSQLEQKGVPSQVTDRLKGDSTDQYQSEDDVKSKIGGLM